MHQTVPGFPDWYKHFAHGPLDVDGRYSTADTDELDEGICDLSDGIDTSFIALPTDFDSAVVQLYAVPTSNRQYAKVENVEREVIMGRIRPDDDE